VYISQTMTRISNIICSSLHDIIYVCVYRVLIRMYT
jgi:hypothetical protein